MKITACSIVKNEEKNIARSIESYKSAVDEIIIVDTGSNDNTVEICKNLGTKVLFYKWNGDFSAAKNYALDNANGDWIIFLDADEWFVPNLDKQLITNILNGIQDFSDALMSTMCQYDTESANVFAKDTITRIFKNTKAMRYIGNIHERIKNGDKDPRLSFFKDIQIYHSGYSQNLIETKSKRNIDSLYKKYNEGNPSTLLYFYLFRENFLINNCDEAVKFFELFKQQPDCDKVMQNYGAVINVYQYMYRIMIFSPTKFSKEQINSLLGEAYNKFPHVPMHSYMIGCEKFYCKEYTESYSWLNKAFELDATFSATHSNTFPAFKDDAWYKLGSIFHEWKKYDQALEYYIDAIKVGNINIVKVTLPRLINIIDFQPQEEIILFLNSLLDISKKENIESILSALKHTRLHKAFIYYAVKYNKDFDGQNETTYIAMILSGQAELAVEIAINGYNNSIKLDEDGKWHLYYSLVAVLYSHDVGLYDKVKIYFSYGMNQIVQSYFGQIKLNIETDEIKKDYDIVLKLITNILKEEDIFKYESLI